MTDSFVVGRSLIVDLLVAVCFREQGRMSTIGQELSFAQRSDGISIFLLNSLGARKLMLDASIIEALNLKITVGSIVQTMVQALSISCLFFAANAFGKRIFRKNIFIIFVIGVLASAVLIANEYVHVKNAENAPTKFRLLTETKLVEFPEGIEIVMPLENRKSTVIVARDAYITHGKIIDYITEEGKRSKFSPTAIDIKDRDRRIAIITSLELISKQAAINTYNWLTMVLVIFLASFFAGILSRKILKTSA